MGSTKTAASGGSIDAIVKAGAGVGDNLLAPGAGDDFLAGGEGDDLFFGELALDSLTGVAADPLALDDLEIIDLVADFVGADGNRDVLDLGVLLDGPKPTSSALVDEDGEVVGTHANGEDYPADAIPVVPATTTISILFDDGANDPIVTTSIV